MDECPDPARADSQEAFHALLEQLLLWSGHSLRTVADNSHPKIAHGTVHHMVHGTGTPQPRSLTGFLHGCGLRDGQQRQPWLDRYKELFTSTAEHPVAAVHQVTGPSWLDAVRSSPLWDCAEPAVDDRIRTAVERIASVAWDHFHSASTALPDHPWWDVEYPRRCLNAIEQLLSRPGTLSRPLNPTEVAVVIAAPFLREAVLHSAMRDLLDIDPLNPDQHREAGPARRELEAAFRIHTRILAKARGLQGADRAAVTGWLVGRHLLRKVGIWQQETAMTLSRDLAGALVNRHYREDAATAVRALALSVASGREDLERDPDSDMPHPRSCGPWLSNDGTPTDLHIDPLELLAGAAGLMAFDVRQCGEAVVNHIGLRDSLMPAAVLDAASGTLWDQADHSWLNLVARCSHPAIHLVWQEQAYRLGSTLSLAHEYSARATDRLRIRLPYRVNTDQLLPDLDTIEYAGRPKYEMPLLTFRLAHDEIRDLLMGVRLYGKPELAVRELYQNALDACRFRRARAQFGKQEYRGRISFRQGEDNGRQFIECTDNGVGMGRRELQQLFSRAGHRFVNSADFLWEQHKWQQTDDSIRLWPNSRWGIGVFSYFMIAEEIVLTSARVDRRSMPTADLLHVEISSSGSLFRLRTLPNDDRRAGTTVRLYLRHHDDQEKQVSALATLRDLLWYSEFDVDCQGPDGGETWPAQRLHAVAGPDCVGAPLDDVAWLVAGEGGILADGITTPQKRFGYVVNLVREHAPELSVDRNRLASWDEQWVQDTAVELASRLAAPTDDAGSVPDYQWLWQLSQLNPMLGQAVWERLAADRRALPLSMAPDPAGRRGDEPLALPTHLVGAFPSDFSLLSSPAKTQYGDERLVLLSIDQWQRIILSRRALLRQHRVPTRTFRDIARGAASAADRKNLLTPEYDKSIDGKELSAFSSADLEPGRPELLPVLQPVHFALLGTFEKSAMGVAPPPDDIFDEQRLYRRMVWWSAASGRPIDQVVRHLQPLVVFGLTPFGILRSEDSFVAHAADDDAVRILADHRRFPPDRPERTLAAAAAAAQLRQVSVNDLIHDMDRYVNLGLGARTLLPGPAGATVPSDSDTQMLAALAMFTWPVKKRSWLDLVAVAYWSRSTVPRIQEFVDLMVDPPWNTDDFNRASVGLHDPHDIHILSQHGGHPPWLSGRVTVQDLDLIVEFSQYAGADTDKSDEFGDDPDDAAILEVLHVLSRYAVEQHFRLPEVVDGYLVDVDTEGASEEDDEDFWDLAEFFADEPETYNLEDFLDHVDEIYWNTKVDTPRTVPSPPTYRPDEAELAALSSVDRIALSPNLRTEDEHLLVQSVTAGHLAAVANFFDETIAVAVQRLKRIRRIVKFQLPKLSKDVDQSFVPSKDDLLILSFEANGMSPWLVDRPPVSHLLLVAIRSRKPLDWVCQRMTELHPLQPALPRFDAATCAAMRSVRPTPADVMILSADLTTGNPPLEGPITPLHILKASALLTEPCAEIIGRLTRYTPLGLEMPALPGGEWQDRVASWQDISVLTSDCQGLEALPTGPVPETHVSGAARTIGESVSAVADRLRGYAQVFGLQV